MDVGKCDNGRHWMLWASAGIDGFVVKRIEPRSRWFKRLGPIGYALKVLFFLPGFSGVRATVVVDNQVIEGDFLLINVSNCRMFAGGELPLNRGAVLDDGQFEVWLFRGRHWSTAARYIMEIGLESHVCNPNVHVWIGRYVAVETHPPTPFHLDGEPVNNTPFSCELKPKALRLLVPDTTPANLFANRGEAL
jgi:diacylglycerol kinase family enzyme